MNRFSRSGYAMILAALLAFAGSAHATEVKYVCDDGVQIDVQFSPPGAADGRATLTFVGSGEKLVLPQVMSADGGRYANDRVEFWIKGTGATLARGGNRQSCRTR